MLLLFSYLVHLPDISCICLCFQPFLIFSILNLSNNLCLCFWVNSHHLKYVNHSFIIFWDKIFINIFNVFLFILWNKRGLKNSSAQFSSSVMSDSLRSHVLQHARPPCPSPTLRLLKVMSTESVMPYRDLILCRPLRLLPSIFPESGSFQMSQLFTSGGQNIGVSASTVVFNEYSGLISFRMDWLDLLAGQGTLKSLLQHHSSKASIIRCSAFFTVQVSHPYMTTGKTIALTRRTFVDKIMSLLFNTLSRFAITFIPRSKYLLISWLQSPSTVIWEPKKIKSLTVSPIYLPWSDGTRCHDLHFLNVEL